jgi:ubiquinone/menaquinone biosynthesis C-methylase UbiE
MDRDISIDAYTQLADEYARLAPTKPHNAHYDRPATLRLVGDVRGLDVLDCGTGTGEYAAALIELGATVTGIDNCQAMLAHAARRAPAAKLIRASLDEPLPLPEGSFDAIVAGLVLDYVRDWDALFDEFRRVTRPGARVVFSVEHPASRWRMRAAKSYHATERQVIPWRGFGAETVQMVSWRRPLHAMLTPPLRAGFRLEQLLEPLPTDAMRLSDPAHHAELMREPGFMCLRLMRDTPALL